MNLENQTMSTEELQLDAQTIIDAKRHRLSIRQDATPNNALVALATMQKAPRTVLNIVTADDHVTLIGQIRHENIYDPVSKALRYVRYGVDAITLFTDNKIYSKGMDDLSFITRGINSPIISQDYIINEYHVTEARAAGASAIMIYASHLDQSAVRGLVSLSARWRMTSMVQVNNADELAYVAGLSPHVIAVGLDQNFVRERDLPKIEQLKPLMPFNTRFMALGCFTKIEDVETLLDIGVDAIIVDEVLFKTKSSAQRLFELLDNNYNNK